MRIVFVGGTGPVGQAAIAHLDGHDVAVAHSGAHEAVPHVEHMHGSREELLADGGPVERWTPDVVVDTFPGGATAAKARQLAALAERAGVGQLVVTSSIDVYRHAALSGVDGFEPAELPLDTLPLTEGTRVARRTTAPTTTSRWRTRSPARRASPSCGRARSTGRTTTRI